VVRTEAPGILSVSIHISHAKLQWFIRQRHQTNQGIPQLCVLRQSVNRKHVIVKDSFPHNLTEQSDIAVMICTGSSVRITVGTPAIQTVFLHGFPQHPPANAGSILELLHHHFLPDLFQFVIHQSFLSTQYRVRYWRYRKCKPQPHSFEIPR
jgi:hypothetical protein